MPRYSAPPPPSPAQRAKAELQRIASNIGAPGVSLADYFQAHSKPDILAAFAELDIFDALESAAPGGLPAAAYTLLLSICADDGAAKKLLSESADELVSAIPKLQDSTAADAAIKLLCLLACKVHKWAHGTDGGRLGDASVILKETALMEQVVVFACAKHDAARLLDARYVVGCVASSFQRLKALEAMGSERRRTRLIEEIVEGIGGCGTTIAAAADATAMTYPTDLLNTLLKTGGATVYSEAATQLHGLVATVETKLEMFGFEAAARSEPLAALPTATEDAVRPQVMVAVVDVVSFVSQCATDPVGADVRTRLLQKIYEAVVGLSNSTVTSALRKKILVTLAADLTRITADAASGLPRLSQAHKALPALIDRIVSAQRKRVDGEYIAPVLNNLLAAPAGPVHDQLKQLLFQRLLVNKRASVLLFAHDDLAATFLGLVRTSHLPTFWLEGEKLLSLSLNVAAVLSAHTDWGELDLVDGPRIAAVLVARLCGVGDLDSHQLPTLEAELEALEQENGERRRQLREQIRGLKAARARRRDIAQILHKAIKHALAPALMFQAPAAKKAVSIVAPALAKTPQPMAGDGEASRNALSAARAQPAVGPKLVILLQEERVEFPLFALLWNPSAQGRSLLVAALANPSTPLNGWALPGGGTAVDLRAAFERGADVEVQSTAHPDEANKMIEYLVTGALDLGDGWCGGTANLAATLGATKAAELCEHRIVHHAINSEHQSASYEATKLLQSLDAFGDRLPQDAARRERRKTLRLVAAAIMLTRLYTDLPDSPVDHPARWMRESESEIKEAFMKIVSTPRQGAA